MVACSSPWFGGWGYGGRSRGTGRPDLSNAQMALDALTDAGLKPDDPAFQAAMKFVSRLQNSSETNDQAWAGNDGGFVYGPSDKKTGESMAGEYVLPDGKRMLRSYGSMTYAGLKSFLYAGVGRDDPRVKAALDWIRKHYTVKENPGKKDSGLYYYYHVFAKALAALGEDSFVDAKGEKHDWRKELFDELKSRQAADGSWTNKNGAFLENAPELATAFALLSLSYVK